MSEKATDVEAYDSANAAVTLCIFRAERALAEACRAWLALAECERTLAGVTSGPERDIAQRGYAAALVTATTLDALGGQPRPFGGGPTK